MKDALIKMRNEYVKLVAEHLEFDKKFPVENEHLLQLCKLGATFLFPQLSELDRDILAHLQRMRYYSGAAITMPRGMFLGQVMEKHEKATDDAERTFVQIRETARARIVPQVSDVQKSILESEYFEVPL